ncbi:hypothetical protein [Ramlibacter humi]|uniref:DUF4175 domain-containing protein n=1 Tax=Ramlibacter humi TaxID=2530451 RepID=A0A4Z0BXM4_9BURK|nr:hypothetical protein [Ramlibacter humi]TFZ04013.1 hypothetical protein EZ216_10280 [Ramlibacter humi]
MGPLDLLVHVCGFLAPAAFLALVLPPMARLMLRRLKGPAWPWQMLVVFAAAALVLGAGLWFFSRDGKMATYAAMVVVSAAAQWLLLRAWK